MAVKAIFEAYFKLRLEEYKKTHDYDDDAWKRDLEREFICRYHIPLEKKGLKRLKHYLHMLQKVIRKK